MDIKTYLDNAVNASRAKSLANSDQLTLGEMILKLDPIVERQKERIADGKKEEATVCYDFEYLFPTDIDSWRGVYSELALNFVGTRRSGDSEEKPMTVTAFQKMLKDCIGKEFTGWKGGEFTMSKRTPVWVANRGNAGNTAIIDIVDNDYEVILITGYRNI